MEKSLAIRLPDINEYEFMESSDMPSTTKQAVERAVFKIHEIQLREIAVWCKEILGYLPDVKIKTERNPYTYSILSAIVLQFKSDQDRLHYIMCHDTDDLIVIEK